MGSIEIINARSGGSSSKNDLFQNAIINPDGAVAMRGNSGAASFTAATSPHPNSDAEYLIDRWILLSDGNDIVDVSQSTDAPSGSDRSIKSLVATANKKFGYLQIIKPEDSSVYSGKNSSLSFQVKTTTAKLINNVRCAVLSWDGTADAMARDIISAWNASGADPTLVANWTYKNTPANIAVTTSWARDTSTANIAIDTAGMTNIAVFIWVDDTDASAGDELFLSQIQLNEGATAVDYLPRELSEEEALCGGFYEKTYNRATRPGIDASTAGRLVLSISANNNSGYNMFLDWRFKYRKRASPTIVTYSQTGTTAGKLLLSPSDVNSSTSTGETGATIWGTQGTATTEREAQVQCTANAEIGS